MVQTDYTNSFKILINFLRKKLYLRLCIIYLLTKKKNLGIQIGIFDMLRFSIYLLSITTYTEYFKRHYLTHSHCSVTYNNKSDLVFNL